ncbi:MAG: helix-hairpin-helix domain-containing protein [bacterium]|nr:helix-hairpin-helix domain-containing protein [bacterium]
MKHVKTVDACSDRQATLRIGRSPAIGRRTGMALLIVTVLTMLIALAAYRFSFYMESQYRVARLNEEQLQARLAALSGLEYAACLLEQPPATRVWQNKLNDFPQNLLAAVPMRADPELQKLESDETTAWRFSLIAPALAAAPRDLRSSLAANGSLGGDTAHVLHHRFGLENESAKLPIPLLLQWERTNPGTARGALLRLPGSTPQLVDHWLRVHGIAATGSSASSGNANGLADLSSNGGIGSGLRTDSVEVDQLQWLWYGGDLNHNYRLDPLELQLRDLLLSETGGGDRSVDPSSAVSGVSSVPRGWNRFLTWTGGQRNESSTGNRRINLNGSDLGRLHRQVLRRWPIEWANFLVALRQFGPASSAPRTSTGTPSITAADVPLDLSRPSTYQLSSLLDVVDVQVVVGDPSAEKQSLRSPFSSDLETASNYLAKLLDEASLDEQLFVGPAIDVNSAPLEVLAAIPGLGFELAQSIVQRRSTLDESRKTTIAWLYIEQLIDIEQLRYLQPYLIGRSDVFSVQAVGFRDSRSPIARYSAIVDARRIPARILCQQQWHPWGRGFDLNTLSQRK